MFTMQLVSNDRVVGVADVAYVDIITCQLRFNVSFSEAAAAVAVKLFKQANRWFRGSLVAVLYS